MGIHDRLLAEAVPREQQRAGPTIPDRDGEHAVKLRHERFPPLIPAVWQDLGVAPRREPVAEPGQLVPQLTEVVDLAVLHGDDTAGLLGHRLMAKGEVDDRETASTEHAVAVAGP